MLPLDSPCINLFKVFCMELNSDVPHVNICQSDTKVMFALWMALLVAMGVWMLRLIPNTGGFPAGES